MLTAFQVSITQHLAFWQSPEWQDDKAYEYGRKASVVSTAKSGVVVGVVFHDVNEPDSKTLKEVLDEAREHRKKDIELAVVDRGANKHVQCQVLLPSKPLKYQRQKKRVLC